MFYITLSILLRTRSNMTNNSIKEDTGPENSGKTNEKVEDDTTSSLGDGDEQGDDVADDISLNMFAQSLPAWMPLNMVSFSM